MKQGNFPGPTDHIVSLHDPLDITSDLTMSKPIPIKPSLIRRIRDFIKKELDLAKKYMDNVDEYISKVDKNK